MKTLPSKELLSEVLGIEKISKDTVRQHGKWIQFFSEDTKDDYSFNIYELAHRCKEWALEQGYTFTVSTGNTNTLVEVLRNDAWTEEHPETVFISMEQEEPEAIFKACEWILEQIK